MTNCIYNISMKTLLGLKHGTIELFNRDGVITGFLNILGKHNAFKGTLDKSGVCKFSGNFVTLVQTIPYEATGYADDKRIELDLIGKRYKFHLTGTV